MRGRDLGIARGLRPALAVLTRITDPHNSSPQVPARTLSLGDSMVTTAMELPACRVARTLGIVHGITARSRSIVGKFLGGLQTLFGGGITIYTELCEQERMETCRNMLTTRACWAPTPSSVCVMTPSN